MKHLFTFLLLGLTAPLLADADRPTWAEGATSAEAFAIVAIVSGQAQDLVVLEGGLAQGLRDGMVLQGSGTTKTRLLIAQASADRSVALILDLAPGRVLEPGDTFRRSLLRI